jgi:hypothetical protein
MLLWIRDQVLIIYFTCIVIATLRHCVSPDMISLLHPPPHPHPLSVSQSVSQSVYLSVLNKTVPSVLYCSRVAAAAAAEMYLAEDWRLEPVEYIT